MPNIDPLTYIRNVLARDFAEQQKAPRKPGRQPLVITLSRDYGALGEVVAHSLGQALNVPVYDKEILDRVAKSAKADPHQFQIHDEQSSAGLSSFLYSLVSGNPATLQDYRHHLCEVVLDLARHDGILVGRGAHLILGGARVFRVRVVGSQAVCAQRAALELNLPVPEAEHKVAEVNANRRQALLDLFHGSIGPCGPEHAEQFDLVINTDHFSPGSAVAIILLALREAGYIQEVPAWQA